MWNWRSPMDSEAAREIGSRRQSAAVPILIGSILYKGWRPRPAANVIQAFRLRRPVTQSAFAANQVALPFAGHRGARLSACEPDFYPAQAALPPAIAM